MLEQYRVLDLSTERGLLCGQILADLGADVVKIEPPGGSPARQLAPFFHGKPDPNGSLVWWAYNRNKRSITLDITSDKGKALFRRLAQDAHFLIESDMPGVLAELGLGYEALAAKNPELIYVSITPFGQDGPKASYADSDLVMLASGGPLFLTGDDDRPPVRISVPQAYSHASAGAAVAALIASHERHSSGKGQYIDISAQQAVAQATQSSILAGPLNDSDMTRMSGGLKIGDLPVRLVWPAKDGHVAITYLFGSAFGHFTGRLMDWIYEEGMCDEKTHDTDWIDYGGYLFSGPEAIEDYKRLTHIVENFTLTKTKAELLQGALDRTLLVAPITTIEEVVHSEQLASRNYWTSVTQNEVGELGQAIRYPGPFAKFSATPIRYRRRPPTVGEHNHEMYVDELGLSPTQVGELQIKGVI